MRDRNSFPGSSLQGWFEMETRGAFHLVKISGISDSAVNGTRFFGSSHWKIPWKSGKSKKVGPFSRLEFPNGMSCSIYVSRSLYQFQVHGRAPPRTGVYDQMEQLFTNRKFHFCSHRNFRVFCLNGKRPSIYHCVAWRMLCHKVNLPSCVAWQPMCQKVNLPSCEARSPLCHKVNLLRCEAQRHHFNVTCDIFGTRQMNILGLCYLFGKTYKQPTVASLKSLKSTQSNKLQHLLRWTIRYH